MTPSSSSGSSPSANSQHDGWPTISAFLARRMAPAMRTCQMLQERQADLATKLARAANLLRTRVDVALEQQNRDLLAAMNDRTRLQLRLQQTVEGLSVAAIAYYVVSLFGYLAKGAKDAGLLRDRRRAWRRPCSCRSRCSASGPRSGASAGAMARTDAKLASAAGRCGAQRKKRPEGRFPKRTARPPATASSLSWRRASSRCRASASARRSTDRRPAALIRKASRPPR